MNLFPFQMAVLWLINRGDPTHLQVMGSHPPSIRSNLHPHSFTNIDIVLSPSCLHHACESVHSHAHPQTSSVSGETSTGSITWERLHARQSKSFQGGNPRFFHFLEVISPRFFGLCKTLMFHGFGVQFGSYYMKCVGLL